jgi:hypothetical protein
MVKESVIQLEHGESKDAYVDSLKIIAVVALLNEYSEVKWPDLCKLQETSVLALSYSEL